MRLWTLTLLAFALLSVAQAQWPTAVYSYQFGNSQTFGQEAQYFPANVLGALTSPVAPTIPASDPTQVVSLGKGGYIALAFDPPIVNGPGADFIVFENAFYYGPGNTAIYDEWMMVSVSNDGENWTDLPYNTTTGEGMAGRTPTAAFGADYTDPATAGGDAYDLALTGLDTVRYVKVTDATQYQGADRQSADLDGVAAVHQAGITGRTAPQAALQVYHSPGGPGLRLHTPATSLRMLDAQGRLLYSTGPLAPAQNVLPSMQLSPGLYVFQVEVNGHLLVAKYIVA